MVLGEHERVLIEQVIEQVFFCGQIYCATKYLDTEPRANYYSVRDPGHKVQAKTERNARTRSRH